MTHTKNKAMQVRFEVGSDVISRLLDDLSKHARKSYPAERIPMRAKEVPKDSWYTYGHTPLNGFPILYSKKWHPKLLRFLAYKATFFNSWISLKIMLLGNLWEGKNK